VLGAAELILHVGDFTTAAVLEELRAFAPVEAVFGNMDEPALRAELPERRVVEAQGLRIGLVHDPGPPGGRHERLAAAFPGCDLVAYGHTHMPEVARAGAVWIVNPGSPTERRRAPGHSMALIEGGRPRLLALDA
jgi:putative phosphoesterase